MTQKGTGKGTPETAWNYWKSASAFLVRYEVGAAWNTMGRELHENEVFIQGSRAERETGQTGVIFEHLDPAMPEARYHPRTFQYISPFFFFFGSRLSCIFCHLYLEKARLINSTIYKFQETLRDSFFFWYGKHSLLLFFCQLLGFQRGLGQRMEKMWEVSVLPAPRLREPLPANYTTGVGSRAPFH